MQDILNYIVQNTPWLMVRIIKYAQDGEYTAYSSTLEGAWKESIDCLSQSLAVFSSSENFTHPPHSAKSCAQDPIYKFIVQEFHSRAERGIDMKMFIGCLKCYKYGYIDLILNAGYKIKNAQRYLRCIDSFFDHLEVALYQQLQLTNRFLTNEKNIYLTIFESLPNPVILLNSDDHTAILNFAASSFFFGEKVPGKIRYNKIDLDKCLGWLKDEIKLFNAENSSLHTFEKDYESGDKTRYFMVSFTRMLDISEKFSGIIISLNDISYRKNLEREMFRLDRLNLVGTLASGIAHEIRNPMTSVKGFLQMLQARNSTDIAPELLELMIDELDRANSIISEYLSLSKEKLLELETKNLNQVLTVIFPLLYARAVESDVIIDLQLGNIPEILLSEKEVRQLVLNLCHNGIDAMPTGGTMTISTSYDESGVVLAISDQGTGIPPELCEKVGTPFFTTKEKGTGMGLAICHSIADRHNARLDFESSDSGTTMFVRFSNVHK